MKRFRKTIFPILKHVFPFYQISYESWSEGQKTETENQPCGSKGAASLTIK